MKYNVFRHAVEQPLDQTTKLIPLTKGLNALVDAKHYDRLMQHHWFPQRNGKGDTYYAVRAELLPNGKKRKIYMHHEVMQDGLRYDHENRLGWDNREDNLRPCTQRENTRNRPKNLSKLGYKGSYPYKKRFQSKIGVDGESVYLGTYDTAEGAARAYDRASIHYFGEFGYTNFPRSDYEPKESPGL